MNDPDKIRVLLVEDDPQDRYLITRSLRQQFPSHHLDTSARLSAAQATLSQEEYDLILLDLGLPDSLGIETLHQMRQTSGDIPIVILSGQEDEELALEAVRLGAQDCIFKNTLKDVSLGLSLQFAIERAKRFHLADELLSEAVAPHMLIRPELPLRPGLDLAGQTFGGTFPVEYDCFGLQGDQTALGLIDPHHNNLGTLIRLMELRVAMRSLGLCSADPGDIISKMNQVLFRSGKSVKAGLHQVTGFLTVYDAKAGHLSYSAAGGRAVYFGANHPPRILSGSEWPLGLKDVEFPTEGPISMTGGDVLVLTSAALLEESENMPAWFSAIRSNQNTTAQYMLQAVEDCLMSRKTASVPQDSSILVIRAM